MPRKLRCDEDLGMSSRTANFGRDGGRGSSRLEAEKLAPGDKPAVGDRGRAKVRGFLPYEFNFIVEALQLEPGRLIVVNVTGDFDGKWSAMLSPSSGGTHVDIDWEVTVDLPIPRFLAPILRPVLVLNHFWTMPRGERELRKYLAGRRLRSDRL